MTDLKKAFYVGRPNIGSRVKFLEYVEQILERNWLTNDGPVVQEFEQKICAASGASYCVATANGTLALELAIKGLDIKGEVLVPSFTFVATAHAVAWQGIKPVFVDCMPGSPRIDLSHAERLINDRVTAMIAVPVWGDCSQVSEIELFCKRHNIKLIFDAAHAFGCSVQGKLMSDQGDATVFSFHATKFLNSFEGGAVCTKNKKLASRIKSIRNFGFAGEDNVEDIGTNAKMTEICAAMGLVNLEEMHKFIQTNKHNYDIYYDKLKHLDGISLFTYDQRESQNFQYIVIIVDAKKSKCSRDELQQKLIANNIYARRYFYPGVHKMKAYEPQNSLPEVENFSQSILVLPTGTSVTRSDIDSICDIIKEAVQL